MNSTASSPQADVLVALGRTVETADVPQLVTLLGHLERLKGATWQRLVTTAIALATPLPADPVKELRHLTPQQVAEILSLKAAYVHELCRTGRIPATKSGKYWMIPVAGLRQWLVYQNRDVDGNSRARLESLNPLGDTRPVALAPPAGRGRRPPVV